MACETVMVSSSPCQLYTEERELLVCTVVASAAGLWEWRPFLLIVRSGASGAGIPKPELGNEAGRDEVIQSVAQLSV